MIPVLSISYGFMGLMTSSSWWEAQATYSLGVLWLNIWSLHSTAANQKLFQRIIICTGRHRSASKAEIFLPEAPYCIPVCYTRIAAGSAGSLGPGGGAAGSEAGIAAEPALALVHIQNWQHYGEYPAQSWEHIQMWYMWPQTFLNTTPWALYLFFHGGWCKTQQLIFHLSPDCRTPRNLTEVVRHWISVGFMPHFLVYTIFFCTKASDFYFLLLRHNQHHLM